MSRKSILIVDDEEVIRDFLFEVLNQDYDITTASDGDEAIECMKKQKYDIVITDMKMPRVSGEEVVKFAHENDPSSKVIIISGYSSLFKVSNSVNYGAFAFLSKPFSIKELISTVNNALCA